MLSRCGDGFGSYFNGLSIKSRTCVNEELVRDAWMVHIMNSTSKQSSHDLKVCEHILKVKENIYPGISNGLFRGYYACV